MFSLRRQICLVRPVCRFIFAVGMGFGMFSLSGAPLSMVSQAPSFTGGANAGRSISLSSLRDKPVVLVVAPSPKDRSFQSQMKGLKGSYERLAAEGALFFAAFTSEGGRIPSNIPFILVDDPVSAASSYDVSKGFAIAVIGRDGNLDCLSTKPLPGQRILDLVQNNAEVQSRLRR
jgi:AhpC/TSA family